MCAADSPSCSPSCSEFGGVCVGGSGGWIAVPISTQLQPTTQCCCASAPHPATLLARAVLAWAFVMSFFTLMCGLVLEGFKDVVAKELEKSERLERGGG